MLIETEERRDAAFRALRPQPERWAPYQMLDALTPPPHESEWHTITIPGDTPEMPAREEKVPFTSGEFALLEGAWQAMADLHTLVASADRRRGVGLFGGNFLEDVNFPVRGDGLKDRGSVISAVVSASRRAEFALLSGMGGNEGASEKVSVIKDLPRAMIALRGLRPGDGASRLARRV